MPDERTYRRRRAVFLAVALLLLAGTFVGALGGAERGLAGIFSPIQEGASKVAKPGRDFVNWFGDTFRAKGELEELREERDTLSIENGRLSNALEVSRETQALADLKGEYSLAAHAPVEASLTSISQSAWSRTMLISKGSSDGVTKGDPVIGAGGLVGTVLRAQGGTAVVRLITDPGAGVYARVMPADLTGTLKPSAIGNDDDLNFFVAKSDRIRVGNLVTTAGTTSSRLPSLFPGGIPIGRVSRITDPNVDAQQVRVRPLADFRRMQVVTVLTEVQPENPQ